ncbi:MAG: DUF1571 domain-containing protein [Mariniblastus sp.]
MRHGYWNFLSQLALTTTAVALLHVSTGVVCAQNDGNSVTEAEKKKTKEPVFRVSKLSDPGNTRGKLNRRNPSEDLPPNAAELLQPRKVITQPASSSNSGVGNSASNRVADSSSMPTVASPSVAPNNVALNRESASSNVAAPSAGTGPSNARAPHPLNRAIDVAHKSLAKMRSEIYDYTAVMAKREQVKGVVGGQSYMELKVRCPRQSATGQNPFSIYMKFLKPRESSGREVIWVDGKEQGKLCVHEGSGIVKFRRFYLDPTSFLAMRGQRYPIYEAGLENLIVKLIEKAERDRAAGPCIVNYRDNGVIYKRPCDVIELIHNERRAPYEFHKAQVFMDKELGIPIRYAAYDWPQTPGGKPTLIEEYTYYNVKVNTGLTDLDFSPENKAYAFPKR